MTVRQYYLLVCAANITSRTETRVCFAVCNDNPFQEIHKIPTTYIIFRQVCQMQKGFFSFLRRTTELQCYATEFCKKKKCSRLFYLKPVVCYGEIIFNNIVALKYVNWNSLHRL